MDSKNQIHIPPGLLQAVKQAVRDELKEASLLDLQACQDALQACRVALIDMEQKFDVWHHLAIMYREKTDELKSQIEQLNGRMAAYDARIVQLLAKQDERPQ